MVLGTRWTASSGNRDNLNAWIAEIEKLQGEGKGDVKMHHHKAGAIGHSAGVG